MGEKDSCTGGDEFKFKSPLKNLAINRFVNCDSHWACNERGKINSSSLSGASSIYNQKKKSCSWKCKKTTQAIYILRNLMESRHALCYLML